MNWYVLYVQTGQELKLGSRLNQEDNIQCVIPQIEYYRKDKKENCIKTLFPGYIFITTDMNQIDFDTWLRKKEEKKGFIRQLKFSKREEIPALRPEEIKIFEYLLNENGILEMSYACLVNKRLHIETGPLVGFDDYITKYDKQNRIVVLSLSFLDQIWKAGVTLFEQEED